MGIGKRKEELEKLSFQSQKKHVTSPEDSQISSYTHHLPTLFPMGSLRPEMSTCLEKAEGDERKTTIASTGFLTY